MTEAEEQKEIVRWFRATYPQFEMSLRASQSGGYKGKGQSGQIRMRRIKAMGGVTGESDLSILISRGQYGCMVLEHKAEGSKHTASQSQIDYIEYHGSIGNCAVITRGVDAAKAAIQQYMELPAGELLTDRELAQ